MAGRLESNLAPVPICLRSRPSQALPSLWCNVSSARNCSSESVSSESVRIMINRAPRSCCHVHTVMQNPRWLLEDVRDANIDCYRIRTATCQDCIFLCICVGQVSIVAKQCNPRNGRVVSTLLIYRFSRWGVRSGLIATIFLSMTRRTTDFVGWDSGTIQMKKKKTSRTQLDSVSSSLDSTLCLGTSPRVAIRSSGRCTVSYTNWRHPSWST